MAAHLGMPHGEMLARMPSSEITRWDAYERVYGPLGGRRLDEMATMIAYYVTSALGAKTSMKKLRPQWDRPAQDWRQMRDMMKALTVAAGGRVN